MEASDGKNRQSGILSIINRETNNHFNHHSTYPSSTMAATVAISPSFGGYPNEPPPRYEPPSTFGRSSLHGLISPPEPRRDPDTKHETRPTPPRLQSLPSIHEALGPKPDYTPPASATLPPTHDLPFSQSQTLAIPRTYPPSDLVQHATQLPPPPHVRQRTPPQPSHQSTAFSRPDAPLFPEVPRRSSIASLQNGPAPSNPYTPTRYDPPRYEQEGRAPERGLPRGFVPAPQPAYTYGPGPTLSQNGQHGQIFQEREHRDKHDLRNSGRETEQIPHLPPYQQGTKRVHEDDAQNPTDRAAPRSRYMLGKDLSSHAFDNSLCEINISSGAIKEWSLRYRDIAEEQLRSPNVLPDRLPSLESVQSMQRHQQKIAECLDRMASVIEQAQKQSEQAMMQQRSQEQGGRPGDYDDEMSMYGEDMKSHSYTSEGKKRRGRAAPPGRCHSCNRAETPEWRRGPDGARTLCNACGLHYAKLTRKNTLKASQNSNGPSIRSKTMEEAMPRPL